MSNPSKTFTVTATEAMLYYLLDVDSASTFELALAGGIDPKNVAAVLNGHLCANRVYRPKPGFYAISEKGLDLLEARGLLEEDLELKVEKQTAKTYCCPSCGFKGTRKDFTS